MSAAHGPHPMGPRAPGTSRHVGPRAVCVARRQGHSAVLGTWGAGGPSSLTGHSRGSSLTPALDQLPALASGGDSPTARRKSPYWAKVMRGSGSSRSHCLSTPVMAWMGKFSSLTAMGSAGWAHGPVSVRKAGGLRLEPRVAPSCP